MTNNIKELNKSIDVLFIHHLPVIGGATQSLFLLMKSFIDKGLTCRVLFLSNNGNAIAYYRSAGFNVDTVSDIVTYAHAYGAYNTFISRKPHRVFTKLINSFRSTAKAKTYINQYNPKVVYLNTSVLIPFAIAAKQLDKKVVWHLREQLHNGNLGIRKKIFQYLFKKYSDEIIAISNVNANALNLPNVHVIYNSVNMDIFNPSIDCEEFKNKYDLHGYKIVSYIGGHVKSKGAPLFIKAALKVLANHQKVKFVLAGEFNLTNKTSQNIVEKEVQALIENSIYKDRIIFVGVLQNVAELLATTNILIWPAIVPHFARPIMEAMVMGVPVIASNFMSSAEIVEDGKEGLLVNASETELGKAIEEFMSDPEKMEEMGANARKKGLQLFDSRLNNAAILDIVKKHL
ncbi:MAG: glycosyltransferase family 4 protein [Bacteroidota bacterium]